MARKFLVVLRCGDASLHPSWLAAETGPRNWDLHLSYFGAVPNRYGGEAGGETISFEKGPKYHGLLEFMESHLDLIKQYDYVAMPDDDLQFTLGNWSQVFSLVERSGAALAQPSLDRRSFWMHDLVLRRKRFLYREVDFVEVMTPVFKVDFLLELYKHFNLNKSSWGLDFLWSTLAKQSSRKIVVIDACSLLHTRRVGTGGQYGGRATEGLHQELNQTLSDLNIKTWYGRSIAAFTEAGRSNEPSFFIKREEYLPRIYNLAKNLMKLNSIGV